MSRHRSAKRFRRYGLAGIISLLSSGSTFYPLSDGPPHVGSPDYTLDGICIIVYVYQNVLAGSVSYRVSGGIPEIRAARSGRDCGDGGAFACDGAFVEAALGRYTQWFAFR